MLRLIGRAMGAAVAVRLGGDVRAAGLGAMVFPEWSDPASEANTEPDRAVPGGLVGDDELDPEVADRDVPVALLLGGLE